jgi:hypothetical protein
MRQELRGCQRAYLTKRRETVLRVTRVLVISFAEVEISAHLSDVAFWAWRPELTIILAPSSLRSLSSSFGVNNNNQQRLRSREQAFLLGISPTPSTTGAEIEEPSSNRPKTGDRGIASNAPGQLIPNGKTVQVK